MKYPRGVSFPRAVAYALAAVIVGALVGCGTNWAAAARRRFAADRSCPASSVSVSRTGDAYAVAGCGEHEEYERVGGLLVPLSARVRERFRLEQDCATGEVSIGSLGRNAWQVVGCGYAAIYEYSERGIRRVSERAITP